MLKFRNSRGWKLFQFGSYRIELWYFPSGFFIERHAHPNENIEVLYLFGDVFFHREDSKDKNNYAEWLSTGFPRFLSLPAGYIHWFNVGKWPLIAINFSRFIDTNIPISASEDIIFTKE